ncbi:MAG: hypothetical protein ACYCOU_18410, partial [Sulfobacillus sp.]
ALVLFSGPLEFILVMVGPPLSRFMARQLGLEAVTSPPAKDESEAARVQVEEDEGGLDRRKRMGRRGPDVPRPKGMPALSPKLPSETPTCPGAVKRDFLSIPDG